MLGMVWKNRRWGGFLGKGSEYELKIAMICQNHEKKGGHRLHFPPTQEENYAVSPRPASST